MNNLRFLPLVAENGKPHDYYIPENIFYRLCMKAKNETAEAFQAKVADEIIPYQLQRFHLYSPHLQNIDQETSARPYS